MSDALKDRIEEIAVETIKRRVIARIMDAVSRTHAPVEPVDIKKFIAVETEAVTARLNKIAEDMRREREARDEAGEDSAPAA